MRPPWPSALISFPSARDGRARRRVGGGRAGRPRRDRRGRKPRASCVFAACGIDEDAAARARVAETLHGRRGRLPDEAPPARRRLHRARPASARGGGRVGRARIAKACRCDQELRVFQIDPQS
ncbi:MAG: hypothetical protein MZW92_35140 [Comamonadaceae bacterium]|nr:hypothetical protein [Comamonadaceae bacterium]